jgi:hypothetical protein
MQEINEQQTRNINRFLKNGERRDKLNKQKSSPRIYITVGCNWPSLVKSSSEMVEGLKREIKGLYTN